MNYRGLISMLAVAMLFFSCKKDGVDYSAYNAAHTSHAIDTTKTDTTKTGGSHGPGGSTNPGDTSGTTDGPGTRPDDPDHPDKPGDYYFKGVLNGKALTWHVTDNFSGWVIGSNSTVSNDLGVYKGGLWELLSASAGYKPQLGIEFSTITVNFDADKAAYLKGFITTGAWPLATKPEDYQPGKKIIVIHYTDAAGKEYSSIGTQTGGSAKVSAVTYIPPGLGVNDAFKIKLTFNCTLYPIDGPGASLSMANGETVIRLENTL